MQDEKLFEETEHLWEKDGVTPRQKTRKTTAGDQDLDAMRTLGHAYRYLSETAPTYAATQTREYWNRQEAASLVMQHFYYMRKMLTMHTFTLVIEEER